MSGVMFRGDLDLDGADANAVEKEEVELLRCALDGCCCIVQTTEC